MILPDDTLARLRAYLQDNLAALAPPAQTGPALSDGAVEHLYALGHRLLVAEQAEQALPVFAFLFAQRPTDPRVLSGFGHCFLAVGEPAQAAVLHSLAMTAAPEDPGHALALGEDLIAMRAPQSIPMLEAVAQSAGATPGSENVARRAVALLELIRQADASASG